MTFSKHAVRLFLKIIKKFRLYRVERHFKISQDFEKHITTLKINLKKKKLPYTVTKILLIGSGKSEILSCSIKSGNHTQSFDLNQLTKDRQALPLGYLVKHYGKKKNTLIVQFSHKKRQTLVFYTRKEEIALRRELPNYVFVDKLKTSKAL